MLIEGVKISCLVLGGGGVTGISWMTGLLSALAEKGLSVQEVDRIIGTSAGATVGAQICSGQSMPTLLQRQIDPQLQSLERMPKISYAKLLLASVPAILARKQPLESRRRLGAMAIAATTLSLEERRQIVASRLPDLSWPDKKLQLVAVDATSGAEKIFDRSSGVDLLDAVTASCAVPGVWPAVPLCNSIYIDGGIRSSCNTDLAAGEQAVLIIAPMANSGLERQVAALRQTGARVTVIVPDKRAKKAMGLNPLNPKKRIDATLAGQEQGVREASQWMG